MEPHDVPFTRSLAEIVKEYIVGQIHRRVHARVHAHGFYSETFGATQVINAITQVARTARPRAKVHKEPLT